MLGIISTAGHASSTPVSLISGELGLMETGGWIRGIEFGRGQYRCSALCWEIAESLACIAYT